MARIRTIKPEFFTSEDIVALSPLARLLYIAIWCEADREGRLAWKPKTFKIRYFPADDVDISQLCDELVSIGVVVLYGQGLACIPSFLRHQHVNPRESKSELPEPSAHHARDNHASCTRASRDSDVQGGREGREGKSHASADAGFAGFWDVYPKKKSKGDAEKAWARIKPDEHLAGEILQALQRARTTAEWAREGGQFIPYPASWLNAKGWLDVTAPELTLVPAGADRRFKGAI